MEVFGVNLGSCHEGTYSENADMIFYFTKHFYINLYC